MSNMDNIIKELKNITNVTKGGLDLSNKETKRESEFVRYYKNGKIPFDIAILQKVLYTPGLLKIHDRREEEGHTGVMEAQYDFGRLLRKKVEITRGTLLNKSTIDENLWERIITIVNSQLYNQTAIAQATREQVDLIYSTDGIKREIYIELKTQKGTNDPLFAFVELLKNYVLTELTTKKKGTHEEKNIKKLILLAPKYYYNHYFKCDNFKKEFFNFVKEFNKQKIFNFKFELKYFDIEQKQMEEFVQFLRDNITDSENFFPIDKLIEYLDYKEFRDIRHNLYIDNWQSFSV